MNPELRRNLWLELSVHRLVAMPLVLALVIVLFYVIAPQHGAARIVGGAIAAFVVLVHFWGSRQASESIIDEMRERTWDWQRLSSVGPWRMTWGKLAGATAFQWYGAAICLAVLVVASVATEQRDVGWTVLALCASGVAAHGAVLAATLQQARKGAKQIKGVGALLLFPVIFIGFGIVAAIGPAHRHAISWYGAEIAPMPFAALSATAFAAWSLLAAHREMSRELRVLRMPWAYTAFTLFMAAYLAGFARLPGAAVPLVLVGFGVSAALYYYALFSDAANAMSLRRLAAFAARGDWRRAADALPLWGPAAIVAVAFALASAFVDVPLASADLAPLGPAAVAMALLILRDAAILLFFALAPDAKRVEAATLLYLALFYWVVPGILGASGLAVMAGVFFPVLLHGWIGVPVAAGHLAVAGAAAAWRWRRTRERFERG